MRKLHNDRGVTLLELILVMGIVTLIALTTIPFVTNTIVRTDQAAVTNQLVSMFKKSQEYAIDKKRGLVWGVCMTGSKIKLYGGTCADPQYSEEWAIPASSAITGFSDITFNHQGEPSSAVIGKIETQFKTVTFNLNSVGGLNVNP